MALVMEGTHTVLRLYKPIQEMCFISLYFPARRSRAYSRDDFASQEVQPSYRYQRDLRDEDLARTKQRHQSYESAAKVFQSCEARKGAIAQLHWLTSEQAQLLTDVLSLCGDCADRLRMGNQDGRLLEQLEGQRENLGRDVSSAHLSLSPERKRAAHRVRRLKKLGSKRTDNAEEFLQKKMKKKMQSVTTVTSLPIPEEHKAPGSGSYVSVSGEALLPMDEHFYITHDGWDFMEESGAFETEMNVCSELVEFDNRLCLGYSNACNSVDEEPVHVLQHHLHQTEENSRKYQEQEKLSRDQPYDDEVNLGDIKCKAVDNLRIKNMETKEIQEETEHFIQENERNRPSETMTLTLSSTIDANTRTSNLRSWSKSPTSCSLSGVFNASYPPTNSLMSMSPILSPLTSKLPSPQMNHRIVLLPEEDEGNKRSSRDEPETEVMDKNGNRRMVTRLDLNLGESSAMISGQ